MANRSTIAVVAVFCVMTLSMWFGGNALADYVEKATMQSVHTATELPVSDVSFIFPIWMASVTVELLAIHTMQAVAPLFFLCAVAVPLWERSRGW